MTTRTFILTLVCPDVRGIVARVTGFLAEHHGFIIESAQYGDESTGRFFLRTEFSTDQETPSQDELARKFRSEVAIPFSMDWELHDKDRKSRVLLLVSKHGHCLSDLLHRYSSGTLPIEVPAVVSNHLDFKELVEWYRIPFYYLPIQNQDKAEQERKIEAIIQEEQIDVVVLARYMQILSPEFCEVLRGRAINIHHSFLPSFKGAKPYRQAFDRGVKLIGATAHYVTGDLDEGPIIEQEVARVDHASKPIDLEAAGRDIESAVLARALKFHLEHRVLINGHKTVVFK